MLRCVRKLGVVALTVGALSLVSCGSSEEESVYLHVFNGYPGATSMSLYGPSGVVVSDLPFGERTEKPVSVDRNLGTDFTLVIDGAPQTFDVELPLYDLYPHETVTALFKRRIGADAGGAGDQIQMYRHLQTVAEDKCRLVIDNALSVQNSNVANFNFVPRWKINPSCTPYVRQLGTYDETDSAYGRPFLFESCDNKSDGEAAEQCRQENSDGNYWAMEDHPWYYPIEADAGELVDIQNPDQCDAYGGDGSGNPGTTVAGNATYKLIWAAEGESGVDFESGAMRLVPPTREYKQCIGWDDEKPASEQDIDGETLARCRAGVEYDVDLIEPGGSPRQYEITAGMSEDAPESCGFAMETVSDFSNTFEGQNNDGNLLRDTVQFEPGQYYFWVMYGRPVNPKIEKWGANEPHKEGGFVAIPEYPNSQSGN